jgi:2-polyprenyl-3-methyl-5-hydroxy-6-metoxy-1,4-benzoquinol methylase
MMAQLGLSVVACELDASKAELASSFGKIDVCDVREWLPPSSLDLILCAELIEHLPARDQARLMLKLRGWLSCGGHLVLSTPQRNSPVALAERAYTRLRRRGSYNWWDPTHVSVLSRRKLERLFIESGFTIRRRVGLHLMPEFLPFSALHWTVHEGHLGNFGFDLVYLLK